MLRAVVGIGFPWCSLKFILFQLCRSVFRRELVCFSTQHKYTAVASVIRALGDELEA